MGDFITTSEAAKIIGCVERQVRQLLAKGKLVGVRLARDWGVDRKSAEKYAATERKPGPVPGKPSPRKPARGRKPQ